MDYVPYLRAFPGKGYSAGMRDDIVSGSSRALVAASFLLAVAGCAGNTAAPQAPLASGAQQQAAAMVLPSRPVAQSFALRPPGETVTTKDQKISPSGGKFNLPKVTGLTGSIGYPENNANLGAKADLSASLTNAFNAPTPSGANIVYFLQATLKSSQFAITFDSGTETAKVKGSLLIPADSYTLYVYVPAYSSQPIETIAAGNPSKKGVLEFTSPFSGATLPTNTAAVLELGQN